MSKDRKLFWLILFKDSATGVIHGTAHGHNCTADYKNNPYYVGTEIVRIDMRKFEK